MRSILGRLKKNKNVRKAICLFLFMVFSSKIVSQPPTHTYNNTCVRVFIADTFNKKLRWDFMFQHRRAAFDNKINIFERQQLQSYWLWIHYSLSPRNKISISPFCYFETRHLFALDQRPIKEWRWCLRFENEQKFKYFRMLNRCGLEYRYRDLYTENSYVGNFRARYMLRFIFPVAKIKDRPFNVVVNDEVLFQFGDRIKSSSASFDQNRIYAGINYELFKNIKLDLGYCCIVQKRPTGTDIDIQSSLWLFLTFDHIFTQFKKKNPERM
jgi:hypothetical protein